MNIQRLLIASLLSTTVVMGGGSDVLHSDVPSSTKEEALKKVKEALQKTEEKNKQLEQEKSNKEKKEIEKREYTRIAMSQLNEIVKKIETDSLEPSSYS
ncbi:hypothetical protein Q7M15_04735 [Candidatus Liberibacter asiaticus]|uniref:hypothetical protein n=1 Tax=Liberibacter asiaticus TaxID=34021 RepID=UPI002349B4EE|nr:hypothetical protein [Candidatus Liberibacter asiaticus]WCM58306.1 hypothetical protein NLY32_04740 [Candidatus Liberibacter asiaticus]